MLRNRHRPRAGLRRLTGAVLAVVVCALALLGSAAVRAAEGPRLRAAVHDGFGRIVFEWPEPVAYRARIENGALRVTFDRPIAAALGAVRRTLGGYLRGARIEPDGRTARFDLAGSFGLRSFVYEKSIVVDLLGAPAGGSAAAGAAATPAAPVVKLRVGEHRGYSRLVFDWRAGVDYRVSHKDGVARLRFDRPARIALGRVNAAPPPNLRKATSRIEGRRTLVTLSLAPGVRLRHFRSGSRVVVDLLDPVPASSEAAKAQAPKAGKTSETRTREGGAQEAQTPEPAPSKAKAKTPGKAAPAAPDAPAPHSAPPKIAPRPAAPVMQAALPEAAPSAEAPDASGASGHGAPPSASASSEAAPSEAAPAAPEAKSADAKNADAKTPDEKKAGEKKADEKKKASAVASRSEGATEAERAADVVEARLLSPTAAQLSLGPPKLGISVHAGSGRTEVVFMGGSRLAATAFVRNGEFWVVFPRIFSIDAARVDAIETPAYDSFATLPNPQASILRFRLRPGYGVRFRRREQAWVATFTRDPSPPAALDVRPLEDGLRTRGVRIDVADVAGRIEMVDPTDDANLVVIPVRISGAGIARAVVNDAFELLPTVQGIAILPKVSGLGIHASLAGVEVAYDAARAKQEMAVADATRLSRSGRDPVTLLDLVSLEKPDSELYRAAQDMQRAVAAAPTVRRTRARMAYARFLFANALYPETLGMIRLILRDDPKVGKDPSLRAMRGAARLMLGRIKEAKSDLMHHSLDRFDDVALWRGVLASRQGDPSEALVQFLRAGDLWRDLTPAVREEVGLIAAEAAIDAGSLALGNDYLDAIMGDDPSPVVRDRAAYLAGLIEQASGNEAEAIATWDKLVDSPDRYTRARAMFRRTLIALDAKEIDTDKAIDTLEGLRFVWRGDSFELATLQELAKLYFAEKKYERGLYTMKEAVTHFANDPAAAGIAGRMNAMFADLFLNGAVDDLPPRKVLTLFYGFRELMPAGSSGDRVIQALVDKLVDVDLLSQAGELLEHQVAYRLEGVERARAGAQLAVIRLMDHKAEKALAALDESKVARMPNILIERRRRLRAQALVQLDRDEEALELLKKDKSREANLLRADIFWRANDWPRVARTLSALLAKAPTKAPLDPRISNQILRLAVAYALIPDQKALSRLRKRFAKAMENDPNRNTFDIITADVDRSRFSLRELPAAIAQVDSFEAFMADMRESLKKKTPSVIN